MINRDIYKEDPSSWKIVNEGVSSVSDESPDVLKYELSTFVCEGQYEKGLHDILDTFLRNLDRAQQPGVWVSGFYGSGKSHLVKMLSALWVDRSFEDGTTARSIAHLPQEINDLLQELSVAGKRHGGLHAASGTLGSSARDKSVRLALLAIIFRSCGLPADYSRAKFVLWMQREGIYKQVQTELAKAGRNWETELDNFLVAERLHEVLVRVKPGLFTSTTACAERLINQYRPVQDVSTEEMLTAIRQALTREEKFPLTLVVLDEVQQYIGEDSERSLSVQDVVEACCKSFQGKLLFLGTGQTAVTSTSNLKKLEGRFTVRIELSDADVDTVIRKLVLAKKPDSIQAIKRMMETNVGEISRHLANTGIAHRSEDVNYFHQDYPLLPVRRRFWEATWRVLDRTGTDSQLRNQLSMVHKAVQTNLDQPLGNVLPADYLFTDSAEKLLQARILPRKVYDKIRVWSEGNEEEQLISRACGLVFLINYLGRENKEIGIRATSDVLADLMVVDLEEGGSQLRRSLPGLLDQCELLMKVEDEYRIETEESAAWRDDFQKHLHQLANEIHQIETERNDRIRKGFNEAIGKLSMVQGDSKVPRSLHLEFGSTLPPDRDKRICVWVRDGWGADENSVLIDSRQAGANSPTIFVFIPKRSADDLRHQLVEFKAASQTLDSRGQPGNEAGRVAREVIETIKSNADSRISELIQDALDEARVFQGGGNEVVGNNLRRKIQEAAESSLLRLYQKFDVADHPGWPKVYDHAQKGAADALKATDFSGEPAQNPVCKRILSYIGGGKKGSEIRKHFEEPPFGWSRDAIDGGLQVLLVAGLIHAESERGELIDPRGLERRQIGKAIFKVESTTVTSRQRVETRKVMSSMDIKVNPGEELQAIPELIEKLEGLADQAGGEAPRPERPDTSLLDDIRRLSGNEQILAVFNKREELARAIEEWTKLSEKIKKRLPAWKMLQALLAKAGEFKPTADIRVQADAIISGRLLLADPNPIQPLLDNLVQELRGELKRLNDEYDRSFSEGMKRLKADENWQQLDPEQRHQLREKNRLLPADKPVVDLSNEDEVLRTLTALPLANFRDRLEALPTRFNKVLEGVAELLEPETQYVEISRRLLSDEGAIDDWLHEVRKKLLGALKNGPVYPK